MKKSFIILLSIAVMVIGIIAGISIYEKNKNTNLKESVLENNIDKLSKKVTDECTKEWERMLEIEANSSEDKISPNATVTLKKYYEDCKHTINEYIDIPKNLVNKNKEDVQEQYINWEIQEFTSNNIILYREFPSSCGQHYILRNDDGKIAIYLINENNEEELYEKTEISIDYLTERDKIEIQNGIRVNGKEELNQLIEDFE